MTLYAYFSMYSGVLANAMKRYNFERGSESKLEASVSAVALSISTYCSMVSNTFALTSSRNSSSGMSARVASNSRVEF